MMITLITLPVVFISTKVEQNIVLNKRHYIYSLAEKHNNPLFK